MISSKSIKYNNGQLTASETFPDAVIDAFAKQSAKSAPAKNTQESANTIIPLERSKTLIVEALSQFDLELGQKAQEILNDPARLNLKTVEPGQSRMMRSRAAGLTQEDVDKSGMATPASHINPDFPRDDNPEAFAIIDYEYDQTISGTIYLAHELGHAIADDYQNEAGFSYRDNPTHMNETQAYLTQHIAYDYLRNHSDTEISNAADIEYQKEMTNYFGEYPLSLSALDAVQQAQAGATIIPNEIFQSRFGNDWKNVIAQDENASGIYEAMSALQIAPDAEGQEQALSTLQNEAGRLHGRSTSILVASGIVSNLDTQSDGLKKQATDAVLGRYGPQDINNALARIGFETPEALEKFAEQTVTQAVFPQMTTVPTQDGIKAEANDIT